MKIIFVLTVLTVLLSMLAAVRCGYSSIQLDQVANWFDEYTASYNDESVSATALIYFQLANGSSTPSAFWKIKGKCYDINGNEWSQEPSASTVFRLASVSKLFTATATMQLYEKGLISLEDQLVQHVPWLVDVANDDRIKKVTVKHLLTHTVGVDNRVMNSFSQVGAEADIEKFVRNNWQPFVRDPGAVVAYSNMALILQGLLIQTVSEMKFVDYMRQNVFDPLGLSSAMYTHERSGNYDPVCFPANAKAYSYEPYGISGLASGDLSISLEDMVKFLNAHLNNGTGLFQSPSTAVLMHTPTFHAGLIPDIFGGLALQFFTETYMGQRVLAHAGALLDFNTWAGIFPDTMEGLFVAETTQYPLSGGHVYSTYKRFLEAFYYDQNNPLFYTETDYDMRLDNLLNRQYGGTPRIQLGVSKFFGVLNNNRFELTGYGGVNYIRGGKAAAFYPITLPWYAKKEDDQIVLQQDPAETNQTNFLIVTFDSNNNVKYIESWPGSSADEETFGDDTATNLVLFAFEGFSSLLFVIVCIAKIGRLAATKCEQFNAAKKRDLPHFKITVGFMVLYFLAAALCVGAIVSEGIAFANFITFYIGIPGQVVAFNVFILTKMIIILFLGLSFLLLGITRKMRFEQWEMILFILVVLFQITGLYALANLNLVQFRFWVLCYAATSFHYLSYVQWRHNSVDPAHEKLVVCVHGLTRNARDFDKVAEKLVLANHNFRVVSVDMPGRGYSDWLKSPAEYNYLQYCADLTTLLASLGFESCYWIGTSMGGLIGMTMASAENSPIKKMFLNDIGPLISAHALGKIASYVGSNPTFKDRKEAEAYFKSIHPGFNVADHEWDHFVHHSTRPVENSSGLKLHYDPAIAAPFKAGATQDVAMWMLWDKITCPVFLMRGATSEVLVAETVEEMRKRGPGLAKFVELAQYGHAPHLFSDSTVDPIVEFLTQD